jgi:HAE1 family hydrophobic/amphiphilic exporter-1
MVLGMAPLALAIGAGSEVRQSMAIVVIGALISSTLLTLVLVPVVYSYIEGARERLQRRKITATNGKAHRVPQLAAAEMT